MNPNCEANHWSQVPPSDLAMCVADGAFGFWQTIQERFWLLFDSSVTLGEVALFAIVIGFVLFNIKRRSKKRRIQQALD